MGIGHNSWRRVCADRTVGYCGSLVIGGRAAMRLRLGGALAGAICLWVSAAAAEVEVEVSGTIVAVSDRDFSQPHDLVLSPDGDFLYVADVGNDRIKVLDPTTLATLGTFAAGQLSGPHGRGLRPAEGACWSPTPTIIALRSTRWTAPRVCSSAQLAIPCASRRASKSPPTARSTSLAPRVTP